MFHFRSWLRRVTRQIFDSRNFTRRWRRRPKTAEYIRLLLEQLEVRLVPTTYTVNATTDTGTGSGTSGDLLYCINHANNGDVIDFNISGSGVHTITPTSQLPALTKSITIDATSQPGYSGTPLIQLTGTSAGAGAFGFLVEASTTTIKGFIINDFTGTSSGGNVGTGIVINNASNGVTIASNWIGTNSTGTAAAANAFGITIAVNANNNTIGGTLSVVNGKLSGGGNLISGNQDDGIFISDKGGTSANDNLIEGNFIGTDITGTLAVPNAYGIHLKVNTAGNTVSGNVIGGSSSVNSSTGDLSGAGNLISGNSEGGLVLSGATGNLVEGNWIGTNVSGTADIANNPTGSNATNYEDNVDLLSSSNNNTIGGVSTVDSHGKLSGLGNLISGSGYQGIYINASTGNLIEGNYVGTDPSGTYGLSNSYSGIYLDTGSASNTIGGTSAVSTTASFTGNLVSGNANYGIAINGSGSSGNLVEGNDVGTNAAGNAVLTTTAYAFGGGTVTLPIPQLSTTAGASTTVSFWMKWDGSTNGGNGEIPMSFTGTTGYSLYLYNGFFGFNVNSEVYGITDPSGFANQWHFISAIFTNGAENATNDQLYIDGVKQTLSIKVGSATSGKVGTTAYLGNYQTATTYSFSGDLAQVAFFNGKRSAATIQTYYAAAASTTYWDDVYGSAVAYYPLTETGGTVAVDLSGNSNNGSLSSTGVTPAGSAGPLTAANGFYGVYVASGASGNTIGGSNSVSGGQLSGPGNLVSGNAEGGIVLNGTSSAPVQNNLIAGNFTGTNVTGNAAIPNDPSQVSEDDIDLLNYSSDNTVGGVSSRDGNNNLSGLGNLISGSGEDGVYVAAGASANLIEGNFIGTDKTGMSSVGNDYQGVGIDSASNNTLGGTATGTGNVISGGDELGVAIFGSGGGSSSNNLILGNIIGLAADGSTALGNSYSGIYLGTGSDFGETAGTATNNTIGGTTSAAYNVIASNGNYGVWLTGSTTGDVIQGNDIGFTGNLASSPNAEGDLQVDSGGTGSSTGGTLTLGSATINGTLTLSTTVSNTSSLTIGSTGVLNWDSVNITVGGGTGNITDNGSLVFNSASSFTNANVIGGSGSLTQAGTGTLTLTGNNTYTGTTTISQGTLSASSIVVSGGSSNLGNATSAVVLGGTSTSGLLSYTGGTATYTRGFTVNAGGGEIDTTPSANTLSLSSAGITANGTITFGGTGNVNASGSAISGAGGLVMNANGNLVLSASNTYTGTTTIEQGEVLAPAIVVSGGSSCLGNAATPVVLGSATTNGTLLYDGSTATYTRGLTVNAGGGGILTSQSSTTLTIATGGIASNGTLFVNGGGTTAISSVISGNGGLSENGGTGTVSLSAANTFSGGTTLASGTLIMASTNAVQTITFGGTVTGGTYTLTFNGQTTSAITYNANAATIQAALAALSTIGAGNVAVSGTGPFNVTFQNALGGQSLPTMTAQSFLTGTNPSVTATTTTAGSNALGTGSLVLDGGTLKSNAAATFPFSFTVGGNATLDGTNNLTLSGAGTLNSGTTLTVTNTATTTLWGVVGGQGALTDNGSGGTLILSSADSYSGATTITAGTLQVGVTNAIPSGSAVSLANAASATLNLNNFSDTISSLAGGGSTGGNVTLGSGTLTEGNNTSTYAGVISGTGGLVKQGSGAFTLTGTNTYSGTTVVSGGFLSISSDRNLGTAPSSATAGDLVINQGTLQTTAGFTLNSNRGIALGPTSGGGTGTFDIAGGTALTYGGILANNGSGSGSLTLTDSGTLVLSGSNSYSGGTTISSGTLQVGNGGTTGTLGSGAVIDNAALFIDLSSNVSVANAISGSGTVTLTSTAGSISQSAAITAATLVANAATGITLNNSGNGVSSFTASNSSSGNISLTNNATLAVAGITQVGSGTVTVANTGALTVSGAVSTSGSGAMTFTASGSDVAMNVNAGVSSVNGPMTFYATGNLTVGTGVTLNSSTAALTLGADVTAAGAGDNGTGTLSINGTAGVYGGTITLRGADEDIASTASVGSAVYGPLGTTPTATLTGLNDPLGLAVDSSGNLYVSNSGAGTVSEFAPGATTPTATLTGLSGPEALAFDAGGNLYVANVGNNTVSVFAPGATTPSATLTGLNDPQALALRRQRQSLCL